MFSYIQLLKIFIDIEIEWMYEQENPIGKQPLIYLDHPFNFTEMV